MDEGVHVTLSLHELYDDTRIGLCIKAVCCKAIYVTDESCNFVVKDCFALNCNLSSILIFPNKRDTQ